jgi:hypothetical protein
MLDTQSIFSISECVWIHIIYSLHLYNEGTYTHIDTIIEEHISRIGYKPQASINTSYVFPLHLIEGKGMYTFYYCTIVDYMTLRDPYDAKGGPMEFWYPI